MLPILNLCLLIMMFIVIMAIGCMFLVLVMTQEIENLILIGKQRDTILKKNIKNCGQIKFMKKEKIHLVWFKKDLRIFDNEAIFKAAK